MTARDKTIIEEGFYIVKNKDSLRGTSEIFKRSKSSIHEDMKKLKNVNYELYVLVREVLEQNFKEKHIRGGIATQKKHLLKREFS